MMLLGTYGNVQSRGLVKFFMGFSAMYVITTSSLKSVIVGALNPVNHNILYQGYRQTSIYLLATQRTSYLKKYTNLSRKDKIVPKISDCKPRNILTHFGVHKYIFADTQYRNLHQFPVTMSRVTYFMLRAHTETGVNHSQQRENS